MRELAATVYSCASAAAALMVVVALLVLWRAVRRRDAAIRQRRCLEAAERARRQRQVVWPRHDRRGLDITVAASPRPTRQPPRASIQE